MSTGDDVANTAFPVATAFTNGDGDPSESPDHTGDDDEITPPPAFTAATAPAATAPPGWDAARTRRYGGTVVTFGRPAGADGT